MRRAIIDRAMCSLAAAASVGATGPLAAQAPVLAGPTKLARTPDGPGKVVTTNPKSIATPKSVLLTVRYVAVAGTTMSLSTPAGTFVCVPPSGVVAGLPSYTCTLAVPRLSTVALTAAFAISSPIAATGKGKPMTGKQWQGDCAGTLSDTCTLDMAQARTVEIMPYAAP